MAYDRALALDPKDHGTWNNKGIVLRALGHISEAEDAEAQAQALRP